MPIIRPATVDEPATHIDATTPPEEAADRLERGEYLLVADSIATGLAIVEVLWARHGGPSRADRRAHRAVAVRLLERIEGHRSALAGGSADGFLAELYPRQPDFVLPFVQVQELMHAWELYQEGVHLAVLGYRVHPYFGTYVPTRTSHLELFATWLAGYTGPRVRAIDVGTGSGVLALMLARAGFRHVLATDDNPNAIESVRRQLARTPAPAVALAHTDLLGDPSEPVNLVVFNPPWVQGEVDNPIDAALLWDDDNLFARFFEQAHAQLADDGRVVVLFSTIGKLVQPEVPHPLLAELNRGRFRLVEKFQRKVKPPVEPDGTRKRTKERVEVWEFAKSA